MKIDCKVFSNGKLPASYPQIKIKIQIKEMQI